MWPPISLTIPLGVPVVPEVYKIYASSFEFISTQSTSLALETTSCQSSSFDEFSFTSWPFLWNNINFSILCFAFFKASSTSGLYSTVLPGSKPHEAVTKIFAVLSSILLASSSEANPPKTTEWMAPILAQANIAITASGIIGI